MTPMEPELVASEKLADWIEQPDPTNRVGQIRTWWSGFSGHRIEAELKAETKFNDADGQFN